MQTQERQVRHDETPADLLHSGDPRPAPSRRTFLIGGATAGLVAAATTQLSAQAQAAEPIKTENPLPAAAIGYWEAQTATVKPASRLRWGGRNLIDNGVRVTVHGLGSGHPDPTIAAFSLFAHFPTPQAGVSVPFHAWDYRSDMLNHRSSPVSFCMPVDRMDGLILSVVYPKKSTTETDGTGVRTEHICRFSPAAWNKQPKLRQGVYFVALPDSASNALPNWEECRFVPEYEEGSLIGGTLWQDSHPVAFHYLILSVDPVKTSPDAIA